MDKPQLPPVLTVGEVAKMLGVTDKTVRSMTDAGILDAARTPGGHRRYNTADVVAYLKRQAA